MKRTIYLACAVVAASVSCLAANPGIMVDGKSLVSEAELTEYVVRGLPELSIEQLKAYLAQKAAEQQVTAEQRHQEIVQYVNMHIQRCFAEILVVVDARDQGIDESICTFAHRGACVKAFEENLVARIRQLSADQLKEIADAIAKANKIDVTQLSQEQIEGVLFSQEFMAYLKKVGGRHSLALAEGVADRLVATVAAAVEA